jgi:hypothetical protein
MSHLRGTKPTAEAPFMRSLVPGLLSVALLMDLQLGPAAAVPRPGAKQLLDNERVTVWDVVWPKDSRRHTGIPTRWPASISSGRPRHPDAGSSARSVTNAAGGVTFQLKGLAHRRRHERRALHAIMIEMKQDAPVGDDPSPDLPPAFPREGAKQLLTRRVGTRTTGLHKSVGPVTAVHTLSRSDSGRQAASTPRDSAPPSRR